MFWNAPQDAPALLRAMLEHATVAVGNRSEVAVAAGMSDPMLAARRLLDEGVEMVFVKQGGDGVLVATRDGIHVVPPLSVDVVCGLGAGDAFGAALVHGLLAGWDPVRCARYANASGALVASRLACADAMPSIDELEALVHANEALALYKQVAAEFPGTPTATAAQQNADRVSNALKQGKS